MWYFEKGVKIVEENAGDCKAIDKQSADFLDTNKRELLKIREWSEGQSKAKQKEWGLENLGEVAALAERLETAAGDCSVRPIRRMFLSAKQPADGHQIPHPSILFPPTIPVSPSLEQPDGTPARVPPTPTPDPAPAPTPTNGVGIPGATGLVKILTVKTLFSKANRSVKMAISIDLETLGAMPTMPPHLDVVTTCDGRINNEKAFFMSLDEIPVGSVKQDVVRPFFAERIEEFKECEYRFQLSNALQPTYFCYRNQATLLGRCSELPSEPQLPSAHPAEQKPAEQKPAEQKPAEQPQ